MDDREFLQDLKTDEDQRDEFMDSAAAYIRMKQDSLPQEQTEKQALDRSQVAKAALPIAGAALMAGLSYAGTRKAKGTNMSKAEQEAQTLVDLADRKPKEQQGIFRRMGGDTARFTRDVARTYKDHPIASTGISAGLGAYSGHLLAKALGVK